ncbi:hypothetical protein OTU49_006315, partial [Cherax quadricarinatus]
SVLAANADEIRDTTFNETDLPHFNETDLPHFNDTEADVQLDNDTNVEERQLFPPLLPIPSLQLPSYNVAFSVRKATERLTAFAHVHFRDVITNIGAGWDPSNNEFVAPYNGGYYFSFHAVGARIGDFTMALVKNGVYQVTAYGTQTSLEHGSNSVFLELRRQDRVYLQLQQGSIYEHPANEAYTTFTGFLVFNL